MNYTVAWGLLGVLIAVVFVIPLVVDLWERWWNFLTWED